MSAIKVAPTGGFAYDEKQVRSKYLNEESLQLQVGRNAHPGTPPDHGSPACCPVASPTANLFLSACDWFPARSSRPAHSALYLCTPSEPRPNPYRNLTFFTIVAHPAAVVNKVNHYYSSKAFASRRPMIATNNGNDTNVLLFDPPRSSHDTDHL
ncbi:hypothetical protein O1611_g3674 [Lasiodiplodia mahajangana]|uniref:Uncharacterized protein n=1 Tax=Lasiodiplodia mahajangana TaxID=1108764 RepID=A0ACC2JR87_9PEZI|nr:hypothetical protein O1611_g3674 [Lasiodiplodia mahajangana]